MTGLLNSEMFVDATIAAEGRKIRVHKVVLSACSSYFQVSLTTLYVYPTENVLCSEYIFDHKNLNPNVL